MYQWHIGSNRSYHTQQAHFDNIFENTLTKPLNSTVGEPFNNTIIQKTVTFYIFLIFVSYSTVVLTYICIFIQLLLLDGKGGVEAGNRGGGGSDQRVIRRALALVLVLVLMQSREVSRLCDPVRGGQRRWNTLF